MAHNELTEKESLELITSMIQQTKNNYKQEGSFYFLLWGWVIMLANFSHYYLAVHTSYPHPYVVWLITLPAAVVTIVFSVRSARKARVVSHLDRLYGRVWMGVAVGIVIVLVFMKDVNYMHNAIIILLSGIGTYLSGSILKFKPLIYGGIVLMVASMVAFNVSVADQYLVGGISIFAGYLIPGYLLRNKEK